MWIEKRIPVSVSKSTNLLEDLQFLCEVNLGDIVSSFIDALEKLDAQIKAQLKTKLLCAETTIRNKLVRISYFLINVTAAESLSKGCASKMIVLLCQYSLSKAKKVKYLVSMVTLGDNLKQ